MKWSHRFTSLALALFVGGATLLAAAPASEAHLATWGSWEVTRRNLDKLFPTATDYLRKKVALTPEQIARVEKDLGFALYPEDKTPEFYVAVRQNGGEKELLGVALFIDPRVQPKVKGGEVIRLEVGIAVNGQGKVGGVHLYDYNGNPKVAAPAFVDQLKNRGLDDAFKVGAAGLSGVSGEEAECQLVANAAREALLLMKVALGK